MTSIFWDSQIFKSSDCVICCQVTLQRNVHLRYESQKLWSCCADKLLQRFERKWKRWGPFPSREINPKRNFINRNRYYSENFVKSHHAYIILMHSPFMMQRSHPSLARRFESAEHGSACFTTPLNHVILHILGSHGIPQAFPAESKVSSKSIIGVDKELS